MPVYQNFNLNGPRLWGNHATLRRTGLPKLGIPFNVQRRASAEIAELANAKPLKKDLGRAKDQPAGTRIPAAVHHPENMVFVVKKALFYACFGNGI